VRYKNTRNIMIKNVLDTCVSAGAFWLLGYAIAFGEGSMVFGWKYPDGSVCPLSATVLCHCTVNVMSLCEDVFGEGSMVFGWKYPDGSVCPLSATVLCHCTVNVMSLCEDVFGEGSMVFGWKYPDGSVCDLSQQLWCHCIVSTVSLCDYVITIIGCNVSFRRE